jgi:hypothetical protein
LSRKVKRASNLEIGDVIITSTMMTHTLVVGKIIHTPIIDDGFVKIIISDRTMSKRFQGTTVTLWKYTDDLVRTLDWREPDEQQV